MLRGKEKELEPLNKMLDWIMMHKKRFIVFVILGFFVPIILVQVVYSIPSFIPFFTSPLDAGDLLGYYAAFIATAGTVFLGAVAVWQNSVIHNKNVAIQEKMDKERIAAAKPYFRGLDGTFTDGLILIKACIKNESNNTAHNLKIHNARISGSEETVIYENIDKINLAAGNKFDVVFIRRKPLLCAFNGREEFSFMVDYEDNDGNVYSDKFVYVSQVPQLIFMKISDGFPW